MKRSASSVIQFIMDPSQRKLLLDKFLLWVDSENSYGVTPEATDLGVLIRANWSGK